MPQSKALTPHWPKSDAAGCITEKTWSCSSNSQGLKTGVKENRRCGLNDVPFLSFTISNSPTQRLREVNSASTLFLRLKKFMRSYMPEVKSEWTFYKAVIWACSVWTSSFTLEALSTNQPESLFSHITLTHTHNFSRWHLHRWDIKMVEFEFWENFNNFSSKIFFFRDWNKIPRLSCLLYFSFSAWLFPFILMGTFSNVILLLLQHTFSYRDFY